MRLVQFLKEDGSRAVAVVSDHTLEVVNHYQTVYELAEKAIKLSRSLETLVAENVSAEKVDYLKVLESKRVLPPVDHPDASHCWITGTGLTHSGSADTRDAMHKTLAEQQDQLTDSMKMFQMGLEGGRPGEGETGVQPEWFYKGDGTIVVPPGGELEFPGYASDGGDEPEIVGLYIISEDGTPHRIGFALGNEYSDHVMEKINYLYLSHSKLRQCAIGPELLLGELPGHIEGTVSVTRSDKVIWSSPFLSGEDNMIHSLSNLEHHHFKYDLFRQPGDLHCHFLGTATFSFADGLKIEDGDRLKIAVKQFGIPLENVIRKTVRKSVKIKKL